MSDTRVNRAVQQLIDRQVAEGRDPIRGELGVA